MTNGFHGSYALLLGLVLGEERAEEAGLLLDVHLVVAVVVQLRGGHAALRVCLLLRLALRHPLGDDGHRLVAVKEVGMRRVDIACLHSVDKDYMRFVLNV